MKWLVSQAKEQLVRLQPCCRGVFFEVDVIDLALIEQWAKSMSAHGIADDVVVEQSIRLRRISLFQNVGANLLLDDRGCPVTIIQPCLVATPLVEGNEKGHFIMFLPVEGAEFPTFHLTCLDIYYDLARAGFGFRAGPGSIPDYDSYLEGVIARQTSKINSRLNFGTLCMTPAMRQLRGKTKLSVRLFGSLRELDAAVEQIELKLRSIVETTLAGDASRIPSHVLQKVRERIDRSVKKNAVLNADRYKTLTGKLEYFDLSDLKETVTGKGLWPQFEPRFHTKGVLEIKFDQLAELRNGIRHSRAVGEVVRIEGEAAILWFKHRI